MPTTPARPIPQYAFHIRTRTRSTAPDTAPTSRVRPRDSAFARTERRTRAPGRLPHTAMRTSPSAPASHRVPTCTQCASSGASARRTSWCRLLTGPWTTTWMWSTCRSVRPMAVPIPRRPSHRTTLQPRASSSSSPPATPEHPATSSALPRPRRVASALPRTIRRPRTLGRPSRSTPASRSSP